MQDNIQQRNKRDQRVRNLTLKICELLEQERASAGDGQAALVGLAISTLIDSGHTKECCFRTLGMLWDATVAAYGSPGTEKVTYH
jgi:hypothetical protein